MSLKTFCICTLFILLCANSFSQVILETEDVVNKKYLLMHLQSLSSDAFEGRKTGTEGGVKAKKYIVNQFYSLGVEPLGESFEQPFSFVHQRQEYHGSNVLGLIKGTEKTDSFIVISAHYDHEGIKKGLIYNGADDNASGVSALFSIAAYFKKNPPKHSVILAAFDGEEFGLKGSKYYLEHPIVPLNKIKLNINLDMISRSVDDELFVVGTRYNGSLKQLILNFKTPAGIKLTVGHDGGSLQENWTYASDHASFYKKNIPFLYFGVENHEDYHMPTDDFENINPEFYTRAVETIISVFGRLDVSFIN